MPQLETADFRINQCDAGETVQHSYNIKEDRRKGIAPSPNLRQVHLIHSELFDEERFHGKRWWGTQRVQPGQMGENIKTAGIDLMALGKGTKLHFISNKAEEDRMRRLPTIHDYVHWASLVLAVFIAVIVRNVRVWSNLAICLLIIMIVLRFIFATASKDSVQGITPVVTVTGQRSPCQKINKRFGFKPGKGLTEKCIVKDEQGKVQYNKAGILGVVEIGGVVSPGMSIVVESPDNYEALPYV